MVKQPAITLCRELRFSLSGVELSAVESNNFAGNPPIRGLAPFCTLQARVTGAVDQATGMLMNIRELDRILRQTAVPALIGFYLAHPVAAVYAAPDEMAPLGPLLEAADAIKPRIAPRALAGLSLGLSPFYALHLNFKESVMIRMTQRFEFSAAHRLHSDQLSAAENIALFGKCNNANGHGHNYELEVTIGGNSDPGALHLMPVHEFQKLVNTQVIGVFDHKHLNLDCPQFAALNPTVENIARIIFDILRPALLPQANLLAVKVWETPKTWCEVTA